MLINKNQVIVSGLLGLGFAGFATATALQFNDKIEYRIGNRIEYAPAWLVPPKAEFKSLERGYGGLKILLALLGTGGMVTVMLIARHEEEQEPVRQKIKGYQNQAFEFGHAAESAYLMAKTQMEYKKLLEADEVAFEGEIETAYCESLGIDPRQQQPALTGTATLDSATNPGDKVTDAKVTAIEPNLNLEMARQTATKILNSLAGINTSIFLAAPTRCGKTHTLRKWLANVTTRFPKADVYVISQKYEDFPGIASNRIMVFDAMLPEQSMKFLDDVYEKLLERKSKPATEETYRNYPIKLILEDWFATHQCLSQKKNAAIWESVAAKLGMIATVGGQYNVGYFICTQSFNIASSGVADSNIRLNLALLAQGLVRTTSNDEEQGSYGVIEQMLNNPNVIASKIKRDRLASDLELLIQDSMSEQTPIILSTIGNPVLGLMPKIDKKVADSRSFHQSEKPQTSISEKSSGTVGNVPTEDSETVGTPCGTRAERISSLLVQILAGTLETAVFATDLALEQKEKMELAKLIIAEDLGLEKTIWLLWGVRRGGRHHALYTDARAMLERFVKSED